MFAMFSMGRPDMLPVGDLGVRKGFAAHFDLKVHFYHLRFGSQSRPKCHISKCFWLQTVLPSELCCVATQLQTFLASFCSAFCTCYYTGLPLANLLKQCFSCLMIVGQRKHLTEMLLDVTCRSAFSTNSFKCIGNLPYHSFTIDLG